MFAYQDDILPEESVYGFIKRLEEFGFSESEVDRLIADASRLDKYAKMLANVPDEFKDSERARALVKAMFMTVDRNFNFYGKAFRTASGQ